MDTAGTSRSGRVKTWAIRAMTGAGAAGIALAGLPAARAALGDQADLRVTVTQSASRVNFSSPSSTVTYTVEVFNAGPATASGVVLTDVVGDKSGAAPLPSPLNVTPTQGATVESVTTTQGACVADNNSGGIGGTTVGRGYPNTVTCTLGSVAANAGATIAVTVQPRLNTFVTLQPEGFIVNAASVRSDPAASVDPVPADDTGQVVTDVVWYGLGVGDPSVVEGTTGDSPTLDFIVYYDGQPTSDVTVHYATADGSATLANGDYTAVSGTLTFSLGGPNYQYVSVPVTGDTTVEGDETVTLNLSGPTPSDTPMQAVGTGTIVNDD